MASGLALICNFNFNAKGDDLASSNIQYTSPLFGTRMIRIMTTTEPGKPFWQYPKAWWKLCVCDIPSKAELT